MKVMLDPRLWSRDSVTIGDKVFAHGEPTTVTKTQWKTLKYHVSKAHGQNYRTLVEYVAPPEPEEPVRPERGIYDGEVESSVEETVARPQRNIYDGPQVSEASDEGAETDENGG